MKVLTAFITLISSTAPLFGASAKVITPVTQSTPIEHIQLKVGENHQIELPSNPSTGYTWQLVEELPSESPVSIAFTYFADESKPMMVGTAGKMRITITAKKVGQQICEITYCRPFDKKNTQSQTTALHITVTSDQ